jgi:hypothetical protein
MRASVLVLPGEKEDEFLQMMAMMVVDIAPLTNIEWLCAIDLGSLLWEVQRYLRWKIAIVMINRAEALKEAGVKTTIKKASWRHQRGGFWPGVVVSYCHQALSRFGSQSGQRAVA